METQQTGTIRRTPAVPTLEAADLNWLIRRYIEACRSRLDRQMTVDGYEFQLRWFLDWWDREGPEREWLLHPDDFALFERYLRAAISPHTKQRLSYHTRHTIIKRLKEALRWAFDKGYVAQDYTKWVPNADGGPPKRKAASIASLIQLLEAAGRGREPLRDRAIVALLMGMGLRREELSRLDIEDVVIEADHSGYAHVTGKRTRANKTGERDAAFDTATGRILVAYLDSLDRITGPLFLGKDGGHLTGQGVYAIVKKNIKKASLEGQIIGPHDLRRAFATHYRRNRQDKASADLLQRQLGHASYGQTNDYTLLDVDDIRRDLVSPLALSVEYAESAEDY